MPSAGWQFRINPKVLAGHLKQPDGTSRPGSVFIVELKRDEQVFKVPVKATLADNLAPHLRSLEAQSNVVASYIYEQLQNNWDPTMEREHAIVIGNPSPTQVPQ